MSWAVLATSYGVNVPGRSRSNAKRDATDTAALVPVLAPGGKRL